jgi:hypothetical protein
MIRVPHTALVSPTPTGRQWKCSGFQGRVWAKAVLAASTNDCHESGFVFKGFNFHLLRHTAGSLMALAGMDPAVAAERMEHADGGALFLRTYRHLYEAEKRSQAARLDALIRRQLDSMWTDGDAGVENPLKQADASDGRTWDRTMRQWSESQARHRTC